jgi:hypothetical protein
LQGLGSPERARFTIDLIVSESEGLERSAAPPRWGGASVPAKICLDRTRYYRLGLMLVGSNKPY